MCQILTGEHKNFETRSVKTVKLGNSRQDGLGQVEKGLSEKEALRGRKRNNGISLIPVGVLLSGVPWRENWKENKVKPAHGRLCFLD